MDEHPLGVVVGAGGVLLATVLAAVNPSSTFAFVWQFVVGFGFIGATLAYRLQKRGPEIREPPHRLSLERLWARRGRRLRIHRGGTVVSVFRLRTWAVLVVLTVLTALAGAALDFGPWAWLAVGTLVAVLASLTDPEAFGWRAPRRPR